MSFGKGGFDLVRDIASGLPDAQVADSPRGQSLKVQGRLMACLATHKSVEPDTLMVRVSEAQRERYISENPDVYYITDHYLNHPALLVRLSKSDRGALEKVLACSWQFVYEKGLQK